MAIGNSYAFKRYGAKFMTAPLPTCAYLGQGTHEYWRCFVK